MTHFIGQTHQAQALNQMLSSHGLRVDPANEVLFQHNQRKAQLVKQTRQITRRVNIVASDLKENGKKIPVVSVENVEMNDQESKKSEIVSQANDDTKSQVTSQTNLGKRSASKPKARKIIKSKNQEHPQEPMTRIDNMINMLMDHEHSNIFNQPLGNSQTLLNDDFKSKFNTLLMISIQLKNQDFINSDQVAHAIRNMIIFQLKISQIKGDKIQFDKIIEFNKAFEDGFNGLENLALVQPKAEVKIETITNYLPQEPVALSQQEIIDLKTMINTLTIDQKKAILPIVQECIQNNLNGKAQFDLCELTAQVQNDLQSYVIQQVKINKRRESRRNYDREYRIKKREQKQNQKLANQIYFEKSAKSEGMSQVSVNQAPATKVTTAAASPKAAQVEMKSFPQSSQPPVVVQKEQKYVVRKPIQNKFIDEDDASSSSSDSD